MEGFKPRTSTNHLSPPYLRSSCIILLHGKQRGMFSLWQIFLNTINNFEKSSIARKKASESTFHVSNSTRTRKHRASSLPGKTCQAAESRFLFLAPFDAAGSAARAAALPHCRSAALPVCRSADSPFTGIGTAPEMIKMGH